MGRVHVGNVRHDRSDIDATRSSIPTGAKMTAKRPSTTTRRARAWAVSSVTLLTLVAAGSAGAFDVVLSTQGEYMDGYLVNGKAFPPRVIVDDPDPHPADSL